MNIKRIYNTDETIINGIRCSDDDAFRHLYKVSYPVIRGMIIQNSGTEEDADDVFQEAVIIFYEKIKNGTLTLTCGITTFLYSVSRNLWLKNLKRKSFQVSFTETHESVEFSDDGAMERENTLSENQKKVMQALQKLGDPCKSILTYFYFERLSMEKIAEALGYTNADNAKNQKYKCLKRLKAIITGKIKVTS